MTEGYRPNLDGLRGIAILLGLGHHYFPALVPHGYVGIEIFFIVSSYIISINILTEINRSVFSIRNFYQKRLRRLAPAFIVTLLGVLIVAWYILTQKELKTLSINALSGVFLVSNYVLAIQGGYFDQPSALNPLLHLWSLSVEEQFYLLLPFILILLSKMTAKNRLLTVAAFCFVAFVLSAGWSIIENRSFYFSMLGRSWLFALGTLLAISEINRKTSDFSIPNLPPLLFKNSILGILFTLTIIGVAFVPFEKSANFFLMALTAIMVVLTLLSSKSNTWNEKILGNRVIGYFGKISYPLYLVHWPIIAFANIYFVDKTNSVTPGLRIALLVVSVILSGFIFHIIEKPVRYGLNKNGIKICFAGLVTVSIAYILFFFGLVKPKDFSLTSKIDMSLTDNADCGVSQTTSGPSIYHLVKASTAQSVMVIGDSFAQTLCPVAQEAHRTNKASYNTIILSQPGCQFFSDKSIHQKCKYDVSVVIEKIKSARPSRLIVHYDWLALHRFNHDESKIRFFFSAILDLKIPVIILGPHPKDSLFMPYKMLSRHFFEPHRLSIEPVERSVAGKRADLAGIWIKGLATDFGFEYINTIDLFCSATSCPVVSTFGEPLFSDGVHLRPSSAVEKYQFLFKYF